MRINRSDISAGYHRLWAHRAYSAHPILQVALAIGGASAGQGSIRTWCRDHRAHHRYVDTNRDPYSISKGFFYAHYGWVIFRRQPETIGRVDIQDLTGDALVTWQRQHYLTLLFFTVYIMPTAICGFLFGDFAGGFIYASCLRAFAIQQATFCVNSLAHWIGDKPYSDRHSSRNNLIVALITWGEGYHNFHHEFPTDYRNGYRWMHWDPTKWLIWLCATVNLAFDLKRFPSNEIKKGNFQQVMQQLENERKKLSWGIPMHELPIISLEKYSEYVNDGRSLILIDGIAHDIRSFMNKHPGGSSILDRNTGKDCTGMFHGEVYAHSNAAINLLSTMRIARVEDISTPSRRIKPRKLIASDHDTMRGSHSSHAF